MNSLGSIFIAAFIGAITSFAGSYAYFEPKLASIEEEVALRPPLLVVDMAKLALESVPIGSGEQAINEHFRNTQQVIDKFKDAGFLVLSREYIISAPLDIMLDTEDLPSNQYVDRNEADVRSE